jgi:hypothetical protein
VNPELKAGEGNVGLSEVLSRRIRHAGHLTIDTPWATGARIVSDPVVL